MSCLCIIIISMHQSCQSINHQSINHQSNQCTNHQSTTAPIIIIQIRSDQLNGTQPTAAAAQRIAWLALAFGAFVVVYALLPQSWLGGGATHKGVLYGPRHDLLPVGAYFLGRGLELTPRSAPGWPDDSADRGGCRGVRARWTSTSCRSPGGATGGRLVPATSSGSPTGPVRTCPRTSSTTRGAASSSGGSPRRSSRRSRPAYLLVVALSCVAAPRRARRAAPLAVLLFAALLWTHTRAALSRSSLGLLVLAVVRAPASCRRRSPSSSPGSASFVKELHHFGPRTQFTTAELATRSDMREHAGRPRTTRRAPNESSTSEHLASLRAGVADGGPPPVGLRPRQRRRDRDADACDGEGGGVDLHGARRRDGAARRARSSSPGRSRCSGGCSAVPGLARRRVRGRARARPADRRDRRSVDRGGLSGVRGVRRGPPGR